MNNDPNQYPQWNQGQKQGDQSPYGVQPAASYAPAQFAQQHPQHFQQYPVQQKSKVLAALLAFFLGTLGVHNFYLGYTKAGIAQLALTVLGYILTLVIVGIGLLFVVGVWVFIEFILILVGNGKYAVDSQGIPLK
ncbi:hypothetical protein ccrud_03865 [Corynebacterium crudilactis]|uniref:TM2 domain-containing protein n=2 Tax=Corynebacterium crudilactis TaxID=1652495 RepID=A0A172QX25_9CORY|nr:hypothetical protein ccrud_03865 [Corynebacterium crudilactis]